MGAVVVIEFGLLLAAAAEADADGGTMLVQLILSAMAALSSVVVYLWRQFAADKVRTEQKLDDCHKSHEAVHQQMLGMSKDFGQKMTCFAEELGVMRGRIDILTGKHKEGE